MTKGKTAKKYRVTGFEAPIRIDLPDGKFKIYEEGDTFKESDWPMPHVTIVNQLNHGTIEEV